LQQKPPPSNFDAGSAASFCDPDVNQMVFTAPSHGLLPYSNGLPKAVLQHVALRTPQIQTMLDFYTHQLGFVMSDAVRDAEESLRACFVRSDRLHHAMALFFAPVSVPAKGKYIFVDFKRFADSYGVSLNNNPYFPIITTTLMRMLTGLQMRSDDGMHKFMDVIFKVIWVDALNLNQPEVVWQVLREAHFGPTDLLHLANEQATKDKLKDVTTQNVERGESGAPTFFVCDQMFLDQDRIVQLKLALEA
jgi:2-hydroxychromene-2-carboxylate isomerase